jgi:hypothetical protein
MSIVLDGTTGITTPDGLAYAKGNILGTVSEASGVPTGAIIERGSNANGSFVKYADGTMICTMLRTENRVSAGTTTTTVTLPATFINESIQPVGTSPYAAFATLRSGVPGTAINIAVDDLTTTNLIVLTERSNSTNCFFFVEAIGRWF